MALRITKRIMAVGLLLILMTGCSASGSNVTDSRKITFVNDLESRKELYKEYPAQFDNPEYQAIADEMYLTFAKRGTQEPEPIINVDERGYIKPLGDGCYLFFEIETYDDFKVGRNKLVNEQGNSIKECSYTEFIYYDENGKPTEVKCENKLPYENIFKITS